MARAAVVITNHNYGRFLARAVDSALEQDGCEVVVVDDGSSDDSLDVLAGYGDRITVVAKDNGGQASAFNAGFAATDSPIVVFLDGDDRLRPGAVSAIVDAMEPPAVRCQFRLDWIDEHDREILGAGFPEPGRPLPGGDLTDRLVTHPDDIAWQPTSGNAFRAEVLSHLLPMPEDPYRISADHYLSNLSALYGPVVAVESTLGSYRVHGANADHPSRFDVERARAILSRTAVTHRHLVERGRALDIAGMPDDPDGFRSLSQAALRLVSFRSIPRSGHPFPGDRLGPLTVAGLRAAAGRSDLSVARRALAAGWILALAVAPRPILDSIASLGLTR